MKKLIFIVILHNIIFANDFIVGSEFKRDYHTKIMDGYTNTKYFLGTQRASSVALKLGIDRDKKSFGIFINNSYNTTEDRLNIGAFYEKNFFNYSILNLFYELDASYTNLLLEYDINRSWGITYQGGLGVKLNKSQHSFYSSLGVTYNPVYTKDSALETSFKYLYYSIYYKFGYSFSFKNS